VCVCVCVCVVCRLRVRGFADKRRGGVRIFTSDGELGSAASRPTVGAGENPAVPVWRQNIPNAVRYLRHVDVSVHGSGGSQHMSMEAGVTALLAYLRAMTDERFALQPVALY
jgi:hypothetical protein